jgi:PAS domain S-box-containing protein
VLRRLRSWRSEQDRRYRALVDRAPVWIHEIDRAARIVFMNATGLRTLGCDAEEVVGRSYLDFVGEADRARVAQLLSQALEGEASEFEYESGGRSYLSSFIPVAELDGSVERLVGVTQDVSARRGLEEQLRQAQKLEAVGRLAGGIAHDFNNLLTAIAGYSELALAELGEDEQVGEDVRAIRAAADRAKALTSQLLAFSRRQVLQPRVLDPVTVVAGIEAMLGRLIGEDVELVTAAQAGGHVRVDPGQLEQVLLNLVVNARDALSRGGRIEIRTRLDGDEVAIEVADDGVGMTPDVRRRIFEPFFTTKELGKGTGLGLATVIGIVEQSGGRIEVETEPGRGSTFTVFLPLVDAPPDAEPAPPPRPRRGAETVLLVEDEEIVRALARRVLSAHGYTVLEAGDGLEGLRLGLEHDGHIDLLLSDVVMPGMGGPELARRVLASRPALPRLFMSGYTDDVQTDGDLGEGSWFIAKPFAPEALARKVREVLDSTGQASGR